MLSPGRCGEPCGVPADAGAVVCVGGVACGGAAGVGVVCCDSESSGPEGFWAARETSAALTVSKSRANGRKIAHGDFAGIAARCWYFTTSRIPNLRLCLEKGRSSRSARGTVLPNPRVKDEGSLFDCQRVELGFLEMGIDCGEIDLQRFPSRVRFGAGAGPFVDGRLRVGG